MPIDISDAQASRLKVIAENAFRWFGRTSTLFVGRHFGEYFPFYYVVEYPKSGGTWLGKMCGACLDVPFPQHSLFPVGCEAVIHDHTSYDPKLKRAIYLVRDGRDVMLSFYFHRARALRTKYRATTEMWLKKVYGKIIDMNDVETFLVRFIEHEMEHPSVVKQNWPDHVAGWLGKPGVTVVKYENLLRDPVSVIQRICGAVANKQVDNDVIEAIVERYSFARMAGRKAGQEDRGNFLRKGIAGDWKNYYNQIALDAFNHYAKNELVRLGYDVD